MESLWRAQTGKIFSDSQEESGGHGEENVCWDVIVVGAGLAGVLTAWHLQRTGKRVLVLEADEIASGQTQNTTAKITSQHGLKYSGLIKKLGEERACIYAQANEAAIGAYERLVIKEGIDCDFERTTAYLYSLGQENISPDRKNVLQEEEAAALRLGIDAFFTRQTALPFHVAGAVGFRNQAQFSPLKLIRHLAGKLHILEHWKVQKVRKNCVTAENGLTGEQQTFCADKIVIAAHYPIRNVPGFYFLRQHQERSYVAALKGCERLEGMYYGIDKGGLSFRQAGEYLLLGGMGHRTGEHGGCSAYDALMQTARRLYPDCQVERFWSAQDCMPHDGIPFIGKYSLFTPNLYVATGFGKWGMTSSMIAALLLTDMICERENEWTRLFSPQRFHPGAAVGNFLTDAAVSAKGLAKGAFHRDRRCTHLGCMLTWNPDEKSWDCPCHGSRFGEDGKVLDNPAKREKG